MENIETMPQDVFWKKASKNLETLLRNPLRYNNNDLLETLPEDESLYKELPSLTPLHVKSSSLDTSYRTYNPKIMTLIERAKQFECITDQRKQVRTPKISSKIVDFCTSREFKEEFQVSGRKAKILMSLPEKHIKVPSSLNLNTKLKEFIGKVQDKYSNLVRALEFKNDSLSFEAVIEYLKKSSILLKRPTYTRDRQRIHSQSPSIYKRNKVTNQTLEEYYTPRISEKISLLTDIFDPFKTGIISKQHFFGILTMYEYTNFGMAKVLPSSRFDFNNIKHLLNLQTQVIEIKRIFKHYSDGKLLSKEGFSNLLKSICSEEQTQEILHYMMIGNKVNFGQFMSAIPLLLENYDNLMVKVNS